MIKKRGIIFIMFFVLLLASCVTTKRESLIEDFTGKLERDKIIYIAKIPDGFYKDIHNKEIYRYSGEAVANSFFVFLTPIALKVVRGTNADYLNEAKLQKADYIIKTVIDNWEPRTTAWYGIASKVTMVVFVIDAKNEKILINEELSATGRNVSFSKGARGLADKLIQDFCSQNF
jgi:hypothetical protein